MSFSIRLLQASVNDSDLGRFGEIRVGDFAERFAVYLFPGPMDRVENRWRAQLRRLAAGAAAVGLATASNLAWVFYRFGDEVRVRQILVTPDSDMTISREMNVTHVPSYVPTSEDGRPISEWLTSIDAIRAFLKTPPARHEH